MIGLVLVALLLAIVVGFLWSVTIGAYAAVAAIVTFLVVLLLGYRRSGEPLP